MLAGLDDGGELAGEHEHGQADLGRAELAAGVGGHGRAAALVSAIRQAASRRR